MRRVFYKQAGFSLIELVVAIVILSIGVTGFITLIINTSKNSVDPQIRVQGDAIARAYMEEILLNSFCDPDWDPNFDADADPTTNPQNCSADCSDTTLGASNASVCTDCRILGSGWTTETRATFDDVCDYQGLINVGAVDQTGAGIGGLGNYTVVVSVNDGAGVNLNGLTGDNGRVVRIDVNVSHSTGVTSGLSAYKTNY